MATWIDQLNSLGIELRGDAHALPDERDVARTEAAVKVPLPASYRNFCKEIGPGRFGDILEIWVPWHRKGFFETPIDVSRNLQPFVDGGGRARSALPGPVVQFGYVVFGGVPLPRVISRRSAPLYFAAGEPTEHDEYCIYGLDRRRRGEQPYRLVKLANSFAELISEGFRQRRLERVPFFSKPAADQFEPVYQRSELPA